MFIKPDCIPCILNMSLGYLRKLNVGNNQFSAIYGDILNMPPLRGRNWDVTSPEVIEPIMTRIMTSVDNDDPLSSEKEKQNQQLMVLYPDLKQIVETSTDALRTAVHLAILGNAIDVMLSGGKADIKKVIDEQMAHPLPQKAFDVFRAQLGDSRRVLYFGDNAGEIVLDKLLIETLKKHCRAEIVFVVRSIPALNDATMKDATAVGVDRLVSVMENGMDGPFPGTALQRCSREVNHLFRDADLIISKGGGNFDSLEEEQKSIKKKITYLLLSKCYPYQEYFGVDLYRPILFNAYN